MKLELTDIETTRGDFSLGPVSLSVGEGVTTVLGPSGAGKSTLLELIAGFETPNAGSISLDGARIDGLPPEDRNVGMVFQDAALFPHRSVEANLRFGAPEGSNIGETVQRLEIADLLDREPGTLSGGERQRVALARTLVTDPDALVLDEPLSSLDAPIRRRLRLELRDVLAELAIPVVYVTHDQDEAAVIGDRVAVLFDGEIPQAGPIERVLDEPATARVARFLGMDNLLPGTVVDRGEGWLTVDVGPRRLTVDGETIDGLDGETDDGTERVTLGIRPTAIDLAPEADGQNTLTARIERVLTRHSSAVLLVQCDGIGRLRVVVDRPTAADRSVGECCELALAPDQLAIMAGEPDRA